MQFHSSMRICENSNQNFSLNGKCLISVCIVRAFLIDHFKSESHQHIRNGLFEFTLIYPFVGADLGKILTVLLTTERRRRKNLGGSGGMPPRKIFSILIALSALSWLLESIGQHICKLHSSWMEPCKPTNYLIKVNVHVVMNVQQGKSCQSCL